MTSLAQHRHQPTTLIFFLTQSFHSSTSFRLRKTAKAKVIGVPLLCRCVEEPTWEERRIDCCKSVRGPTAAVVAIIAIVLVVEGIVVGMVTMLAMMLRLLLLLLLLLLTRSNVLRSR